MAASVNARNFLQSLFESTNSVFVFAMLEKRIDWRGLVSQASEQTLKNRTFSTKTGKVSFVRFWSTFWVVVMTRLIWVADMRNTSAKKRYLILSTDLGVKVVKVLRETLTYQRAILKKHNSKIKSWKTLSYFENLCFFSPRSFWPLLSFSHEKIRPPVYHDPKSQMKLNLNKNSTCSRCQKCKS